MTLDDIKRLVDSQAEDEGLWFIAQTAGEGYLQSELRRLHGMVECAEGISLEEAQVLAVEAVNSHYFIIQNCLRDATPATLDSLFSQVKNQMSEAINKALTGSKND